MRTTLSKELKSATYTLPYFQTAVKLSNGEMILVDFSNNSKTTVKNTLTKSADVKWFDPSEGRETKADAFKPGEQRQITPPSGWEDAIFVLTAKE